MNKSAIILFLIMALVGSLAKKSTIRIDYAGSCADFQRTDAKTLQVSTVHGESCLPISPFFAFKDVNDVAFTYKCRASHKKAGMSVIRIDLTATSNYTVSLIPHKPIRARGDFNYKRRPACMVSNIAACTNETSKCHEMPVELTPNGYVSHFDRIYLVRQGVEMNVCYVQNRTCCHYLAHEKGICMIEYQAPINSIHKREEQAGEGETEEGTEEETRTEEEGEEAGLEGTTESTDNTEAKKEEQETEPETNKPEQETEGEAKKDEQEAPKKDEHEKTEAEKEKEEMDKKSGVKPLGRAGEDRDKKFLDGNQLDETYTEGDRSHPYKLPLCINAPGSLACVVLENDRPPKQHEGYYNGHNSNGHKSNSVLKPAPKYKFQPFVSRDGLHQDVNGNFFEVSFDEERERYNDDQKRKVPQ